LLYSRALNSSEFTTDGLLGTWPACAHTPALEATQSANFSAAACFAASWFFCLGRTKVCESPHVAFRSNSCGIGRAINLRFSFCSSDPVIQPPLNMSAPLLAVKISPPFFVFLGHRSSF